MARLQTQLRARIRGLERALAGSPDAQSVHLCRQFVKQSRAILRLLRPELSPGFFRRADRELGAVAGLLQSSRDRTVILETLAGIGSERAFMLPAIRDIERHWRNHFRALSPATPRSTDLAAARRRLRLLSSRLEEAQLPSPGDDTLRRGLAVSYRKARRAWKRAVRSGAAEDWHTCRKHTKYLDYQLACVVSLTPALASLRRRAHKLGSVLGRAHDLVDLREALRRSQVSSRPSGAAVLMTLSAREDLLLRQAGKIARELFARRTGAFERLLPARAVRISRVPAGSRAKAGSTRRRTDAREAHAPPAR